MTANKEVKAVMEEERREEALFTFHPIFNKGSFNSSLHASA